LKRTVAAHLAELQGQGELYFYPNRGNAGDSLIACATFQLFERIGLTVHPIKEDGFDAAGKIVLYGGGGNLVAGRREARQFVERHHASAKRLVVLPHTISGHEDLLAKLGSNVDLFAREEVSYNHIKRHAFAANLFLNDDLAFGLNVEAVLAADCSRPYRNLPLKRLIRRDIALLKESVRRADQDTGVLNCFRTDKEKTDIRLPRGNMDLSKLFKCRSFSPEQSLVASNMILRVLSRYDEIRTNRLHLAIAGALLGKRVKFYPNSYYKCEAVYEFSMKGRFPNVQWRGN
jgi:exopolysaccharide biosynthesis predicted pyruvyltransferase EpsI